jgi:hypothetical protein
MVQTFQPVTLDLFNVSYRNLPAALPMYPTFINGSKLVQADFTKFIFKPDFDTRGITTQRCCERGNNGSAQDSILQSGNNS